MTVSSKPLDPRRAAALVEWLCAGSIVPTLIDYIAIPNKSPSVNADWERHGHLSGECGT